MGTDKPYLSKCDYVVEQLRDSIINGEYKTGDRLPSEPVLCEMFSVSRISVREALKKLSTMGLIRIIQGKGTFVNPVDVGMLMQPIFKMVNFEEIDIETIYASREFIDGGAAYLAAKNRTQEDLDRIRTLLYQSKQVIEDREALRAVQLDYQFHEAVAHASHNVIMAACADTLQDISTACVKRNHKYLTMMDSSYEEHSQVYEAIERGDCEAAYQGMVLHARNSRKVLS